VGFQALDAFQAAQGRLPEPGNQADAAELLAAAKAINDAAADKVGGWVGVQWGTCCPCCCGCWWSPRPHFSISRTALCTAAPSYCRIVPQAELDEGVPRKLAATARAALNPMAAMFGGVVGQEVGGGAGL
jgi:hypothetical protein